MDIRIHSIVDVVTNSSSTIFVWPKETAIETARQIVQEMMTALGVKGTPEDYFNISFEIDPEWLNGQINYAKAYSTGYVLEEELLRLKSLTIDSPEVRQAHLTMCDDYAPAIVLRLSPKNCDSLNISSKMLTLFNVEEIPD